MTEEPGAVVPHAGICAGAARQRAVLPRRASGKVVCVWSGESPDGVRPNQPPLSSVALKQATVRRSVHREAGRPQGSPHSLKLQTFPSVVWKRTATASRRWKPKQRSRHGETSEGPSGSLGVACLQRHITKPERPQRLRASGRPDRAKRGGSMAEEESDRFVVLRGRESRPHGEGTDSDTQPVQETFAGQTGSDNG